ncbi:hypothetical protein D9619_006896 [Psilocybe cf. subviscida]|uniref:Uncharacterized protein n=1 Tax=Psilocybe cf. subviscida TaxID=2480587 RepID=A0A8H5B4I5_9AGAR|nr:hypothetical protein D9619_006896 [Psilocybe cf. subviscida]
MELEVPTPITYSSTHAQLNLLSVNDVTDGPQSPKGLATSVSMPAFILYPGSISTSITISVTNPHGDTVDYKPGAGGVVGDEDREDGDDDDDDDGYARRVPALGYFSSCSSIDSLATLASHEDLAAFATASAPAVVLVVAPPVAAPAVDGDGLDAVGAPQQAQQVQHFLRFQQTQQARYAELFDEAYGADDNCFDFFGYGRNFRESVEIEDAGVAVVEEDCTTAAGGWAAPEGEEEEAPRVPFLVRCLVPVLGVPVSHERDAKDAKAKDSVAEADKENHNPVNVGVDAEEQATVAVVKDVVEDATDMELSTLDTLDVVDFTPASILTSISTHDLNVALRFTLDDALDFGFDFSGVLDEVVRRAGGIPSSIDATKATTNIFEDVAVTHITTPIPTLALSKFADESPYSLPSVYSTASAPYSPYPFATPQPDQQAEVQVIAEATSICRALSASVPTATPITGAFDAYDPTCFDGLGFESMDLRLRADGSVQVVFDADAEDETEDVDVEHGKEEDKKEERGDDSFSHIEVVEQGKKVDIGNDALVVYETTTTMTDTAEAFEKWRQACLSLAAFANIPAKAAIVSSMKWPDLHEGEQRGKDDVSMAGFAGTIEVFGVTVSEVTEVVAAPEVLEASEDKGTDPSGSESVLDDAAGAVTAFTSQPKIEPVSLPCALRESGVPEPAASLTTINEPEEEGTLEGDEAHEVSPPPEDIVSYIYSIPGPECMPSFAAVIAEHLSPAPAPVITPASSFAIPVASSLDDCPLLSESAPAPMQSSSFASLQTLTESQSVDMLAEQSMSIDDVDNMPSLMAEESPFNALADVSFGSSSSMSSFCEDDMVFPDDVDVLEVAEMETESEFLHAEREFLIEVGSPTADLSNVPLDNIQEEPEDNMDPECAELLRSLAELERDYESDDEADYDVGNSSASASFSIIIAPSPLLTVYEELSGGPKHLFNSIPRYAMRSLDSLSHPWLSSISSLSSLGGRSSIAHAQKESSQMSRGSEVTSSDSPSMSSGAAPAAASQDDRWSLVASPRPGSLSSLETPRRPSAGPPVVATPSLVSSPAIQKKHRSGFFMSRMTFCPSPSPKRPNVPSPTSSTLRPCAHASVPSLTPAPVERTEATGTQARPGGRIRSIFRKLRTLF